MTSLRPLAVNALAIAVAYAKAQVVEVGNNGGDQVSFFQATTGGPPNSSWCADFVYACFLKAYCESAGFPAGATDAETRRLMLLHADTFSSLTGIPRTGYCPTVAATAKQQGRLRDKTYTPLAGDLVLYDWLGQGEPHHVGFVRGVQPDGQIRSVEGNTSSGNTGSQGNGGGVYLRVRPRTHIFGFVSFT